MPLANLPAFDGSLLTDEATRKEFSIDLCRNVERVPLAVLKPGSVSDVVKLIRYANETGLKVSVRGQGHSRWGQTLAQDGVLIDSSTLNVVSVSDAGVAEAQTGAFWQDVVTPSLQRGLVPPTLGTCLKLSVGGILNVGGYSNSSHLHGGIVDQVLELEVVSGDGRLLDCSPRRNPELFEMTLAGMGNIAMMVRAKIRLMPAPEHVVRQDLFYDDLSAFLRDASHLVRSDLFDHVNSRATKHVNGPNAGRWTYSLNVGKFYHHGTEPEWTILPEALARKEGLAYSFRSEPQRAAFVDYLQREAGKNSADLISRRVNPRREPSITMIFPASATQQFMELLAASPDDLGGLADFQFNAYNVRAHRRPLYRFPDEDVAFGFWLYPRNVPLDDAAGLERAMRINQRMLEQMHAVGGKAYPPYAPYTTLVEWAQHYGPAVWQRLQAAKREYDPNSALSPSLGMSV
jgi:cytokinin dehydrogenase